MNKLLYAYTGLVMPLKYDDAWWHYDDRFPDDLSREGASTYIGMFLAWAILNGLGDPIHYPEDKHELEYRLMTPGEFLRELCNEEFTDEDLNDEGNAFTQTYFDIHKGRYLADYIEIVGDHWPSIYHVPDTWETYDRLQPVLDRRFAGWRAARRLG